MKRLLKALKWTVIVGACLFVIGQLIRPARTNPVADPSLNIESRLHVEPEVAAIFDRSCVDCHSNRTAWPWYTNVFPVSWFITNHVNEGRRNVNLSEWGKYDSHRQDEKLREICDQVKAGEMPLNTYTPLHANSRLTTEDVRVLCDWTARQRAALASH